MDISDLISEHETASAAASRKEGVLEGVIMGVGIPACLALGIAFGRVLYEAPPAHLDSVEDQLVALGGPVAMGLLMTVALLAILVVVIIATTEMVAFSSRESSSFERTATKIDERVQEHYGVVFPEGLLKETRKHEGPMPAMVRTVDDGWKAVAVEMDWDAGQLTIVEGLGENVRELKQINAPAVT